MLESHTLSLIFVIFFVISVVVEVGVLLGLLVAALIAFKKVTAILNEIKAKATPIIGNVQSIVQDVTPKVKTISSHLVEISETVRDQTKHVNSTVDEVVGKTRAQASKVDEMVSAVLGGISHAGTTVSAGVAKPVRKVSSILHGIRVGLDTLFETKPAGATRSNGSTHVSTEEIVTRGGVSTQAIHPPPTTSSSL